MASMNGRTSIQADFSSYFSASITELENNQANRDTVRAVYRELSNCLASLERQVSQQESIKVQQHNEMNQVCANIAELHDRVAKARRREVALADRVDTWVAHLREEQAKQQMRLDAEGAGQAESAVLSEDIDYHCAMLVHKKQEVEGILAETKQRRQHHKAYLARLKSELRELQQELKDVDSRTGEIAGATKKLQTKRVNLEGRLSELQKKEMDEKLSCQTLERALCSMAKKNKKKGNCDMSKSSTDSTSNFHLSYSTTEVHQNTTMLADEVVEDLRRLTMNIRNK